MYTYISLSLYIYIYIYISLSLYIYIYTHGISLYHFDIVKSIGWLGFIARLL